MVDPISNIRRIYSRPQQRGTAADPGKISTCIQVAVRPQTTVFAHETMFAALADACALGAGLAGIGRVHVFDRNTRRFRLVFNEALKLAPCPAVQAATHALARLDAAANVRQVFHRDLGHTRLEGCLDDGLARFVIDVLHTPRLLAGDLPELLSGALTAVGLEAAAQGKVTVALIAQWLAAKDLAQAMGGEVVFSDIHTHHRAGCHRLRVAGLDDKVEKPPPFAQYQLRLLRLAGLKDAALMFAGTHGDLDTAIKRVERDSIVLEGVGAFVEVHAGALEADFRDRLIFPDAPEFLLRLVGLAHREDDVAAHLAAQRRGLPQVAVRSLVQPNPVPQTILTHDGNQTVARIRVSCAQRSKRSGLLRAHLQPDRRRAHHRLSPLGDMLGTLDVATDGFGTDVSRRADGVRRRPQVGAPQPFLQRRELLKQTASRDALEYLDSIGHGNGRRDADEPVDVIRLNLPGNHLPIPLRANRIPHRPCFLRHRSNRYVAPILRAPDHRVRRLIDTMTFRDHIDHGSKFTPHGALRAPAIPTSIEIAGFLAEIL